MDEAGPGDVAPIVRETRTSPELSAIRCVQELVTSMLTSVTRRVRCVFDSAGTLLTPPLGVTAAIDDVAVFGQ
jgi:hypothetical protein